MPVFQLPKIAHPDFALPGRKPVGGVKLARTSLTKNMGGCFLFQQMSHGGLFYNLANNQSALECNGDVANLSVNPIQGTMLCRSTTANNNFDAYNIASATQNFSVVARLYITATATDLGITATGAQAPQFWLDKLGSNLRLGMHAGTVAYSSTVIGSGDVPLFVTVGASMEWTGSAWRGTTYFNGVKQQDDVALGSNTSTAVRTMLGTTTLLTGKPALQSDGSCQAEYWYSWENRLLTDDDHMRVYKDPYGDEILKPQVPMHYFTAEAAAGGFEPQWARNANTIIQQVAR